MVCGTKLLLLPNAAGEVYNEAWCSHARVPRPLSPPP